ncbi:MAG: hypothetical protein JNL32_01920 [Candidatus Kapabacteria bacterium]|nr:hypothetical protein [Candidatus Kapabacteria bacterium]
MKQFILALFACVLCISLNACSITYPLAATENRVGSKVGESSGNVFFGWLEVGTDFSIRAAAKNAGITKISTVDIRVTDFWFFSTYTCVVTGE